MHPHLIALAGHLHQHGHAGQNALVGGLTGWLIVSVLALFVIQILKLVFRRPAAR